VSVIVDHTLLPTLEQFGAFDIGACFNCGNCTAVCPLSEGDTTFPRKIIRYAQVGMQENLLSSKELWTCYACGECSETCPRQAEPSEFMAAARRYAIGSYDRTGLARTMYTRPVLGTGIAVFLAAFFAIFMAAGCGAQATGSLDLFGFVPEDLIHTTGIIVMVIVALAGLAGIVTMARQIGRAEGVGWRTVVGSRAAVGRSLGAVWEAIGLESLGQRRYRADCDADKAVGDADKAAVPLYRRRWLLHAVTMWGFLGLLGATILDYGLALLGIKATGTPVPIWYPVRMLGTIAGLMLVYGTSVLILDRFRRANRSVAHSTPADWTLLALLWITGVTGFALEVALYLPGAPVWGYWVFLVHVAVAMELVLLAPFMKLAHVLYRPVALFFYALARTPEHPDRQGGTT
jgi:ferredoxin